MQFYANIMHKALQIKCNLHSYKLNKISLSKVAASLYF